MTEFPELLKAYCKYVEDRQTSLITVDDKLIRTLMLDLNEQVPAEYYDPAKAVNRKGFHPSTRRALNPHPNFPFLRRGAVNYALTELCNLGWFPRKMDPQFMPEDSSGTWDNYIKVKSGFTALYCAAQVSKKNTLPSCITR